MMTWVAVWLMTSAFVVYRRWRAGLGVGLLLAFVANFGVLHGFASLLYLLPWFDGGDPAMTAVGMRVSAMALLAAAIGVELASLYLSRRHVVIVDDESSAVLVSPAAVNLHLVIGLLLYSVLAPVLVRVRSLGALVGTGSALLVMSISLKCWNAWQLGRYGTVQLWIICSLLFPIFTVLTQGYLGYGFALTSIFAAFVLARTGPRWWIPVISLVVAYASLSVYCTYMRDRQAIREAVWGGSSLSERIDSAATVLTATEWFDPLNLDHLRRIDDLLNQDDMIGHGVMYLDSGAVPFARGATVYMALLNVVPRVVWPDKPMFAGSGNLMATYTGLEFDENTSVGIGTVFECFVNFGLPGVVLGFVLLGGLIVIVDWNAARALQAGDLRRFTLWYLPGLSVINLGGSMVEQTATVAAAWVMAQILNHYITFRWPYMRSVDLAPAPSASLPVGAAPGAREARR